MSDKDLRPLATVGLALAEFPEDPNLVSLAAYAAIVEEKPDAALLYLKRLSKRYEPRPGDYGCQAIAFAQKGQWPMARAALSRPWVDARRLPNWMPPTINRPWLRKWFNAIHDWEPVPAARARAAMPSPQSAPRRPPPTQPVPNGPGDAAPEGPAPLPRIAAHLPLRITLPEPASFEALGTAVPSSLEDFQVRLDLSQISLLESFDELACLSHLRGVDHYFYQVETARKVLKQFHGRVLLADEVGLGKTIEAGMILKEYILRGMVRRVLVLVPPALVGQWWEEMGAKFAVDFVTSNSALAQRNPAGFWSQPRIIASIALARRENHQELLFEQEFDLVIVDEAHHLRNRSSKNWKVVDRLRKRFLLLLSATPVQNNLVELYNLLTLLKPGIFKTEREFRAAFMTRGNPRLPANRESMQGLMRDVMIRNTRALVDVRLPARHALTEWIELSPEEAACYRELSDLIRRLPLEWLAAHHLALHHLLECAGSSSLAAAAALRRFAENSPPGSWAELIERYARLDSGGKCEALLQLLERNPAEKKIVFVRFRDTLHLLTGALERAGIRFAVFAGGLSGAEKDSAIERFRADAQVLLSTESGGEGRNLQFCNTLINYDLPWNPQLIEQRIGRLHRIGQAREVFIFNLVARGTAEERMLRILDEKINMFELVVGELQSILGELDEDPGFARMIFAAWIAQTDEGRERAFEDLGEKLVSARREYESAKQLDAEVFGEDFEVV